MVGGRRTALIVVTALLAAACSSDSGSTPTTTSTTSTTTATTATTATTTTTTTATTTTGRTSTEPPTQATVPTFQPTLAATACPSGHPAGARCSRLTVLADRSDPDGDTITLPVAVLPAASLPTAGALVIPAGGPGYPGYHDIGWVNSAFHDHYDIVLYDQRGTGEAVPELDCPSSDAAFEATLQAAKPNDEERAARVAAMDQCLADVTAKGIDLGDYDSEASADDLDELRQALGYDRWNILGISYGARLALATMRSHPDGIRAVILDSVSSVANGGTGASVRSAGRALQQLIAGCAASAPCTAAHGDLGALIEQTRAAYNATPVEVDVDLQDGNGAQHWVITGDDMMAGIFNAMYDSTLIPLLPSFVDALSKGDTSIVPALIQRGVPFATGAAEAMSFATDCADWAGLHTAADDATIVADPGPYSLLVGKACPEDWPPTSAAFNEPIVSDLPALVLAGSYDPITPPAYTKAVADSLTNATFAQVEPSGHGVTGYDDCVTGIEQSFLDDPTVAPDIACAAAIPPPAFA